MIRFILISQGSLSKNISPLIGLILTFFFSVILLLKPSFFEVIENKLLDYRFLLRGSLQTPENIVIVAIDERSLESIGRWPWSRDVLASLVDKLQEAGVELIVFDIILSERSAQDQVLRESLDRAGNVILPMVFDFEGSSRVSLDVLEKFAIKAIQNPQAYKKYGPIEGKRVLLPVPELLESAMSLGHINMFPDKDGSIRWEALLIAYEGYLFPSLGLRASALYLGVPEEKLMVLATEGIRLGKRFIPTDPWGRIPINYYGPERTFEHLSVVDILKGNVSQEKLMGKIVLVGATAVGIYDLRVTPYSPAMPGVEKHASLIASILENKILRLASQYINLLLLVSTGLILTLVLYRSGALAGLLFFTVILFGTFLLGFYLFQAHYLWVNLAFPSINLSAIFISTILYNYAMERLKAIRIKAMFSSYVTEKVVNELIKNPNLLRLGGQRKDVSVLFSDIRGFTTFSEKHKPEEVVSLLNEYLSAMTEVVFKWDGTLDKFIGDAIMAFWGAPLEQENHAELAVRCAVDMIKRLRELQQKWQKEGKPILDCGIGINSGEVLVGNIGAEGKKMDYTVIGDHVNLASRVEGLTRKYNAHILITEFTFQKLQRAIEEGKFKDVEFVEIEKVLVKGKEKPVTVYEVKPLTTT